MIIKIFTWKEKLKKENRSLWFPLLFELFHLKNERLLQKYTFVESLQEADIFVLPLDVGWFYLKKKEKQFWKILEEVKLQQKKIWIYSAGDYGKSIYDKDLYTFRLGGFESKLNANTFILPSFINDPLKVYERKLTVLEKGESLNIGFIGRANNSIYCYLYDIGIFIMLYLRRIMGNYYVDHQSFFSSSRKRFYLLGKLQKDRDIRTNFIYRTRYKAGAKTDHDRQKTKHQFFDNIQENAFTFCYRGQGNYSVRLYEVMALGRIPLLVQSDSRLPLPWKNWDHHVIICDENNFKNKIIQFYNNISEENFKNIQLENRKFWENYLTRTGFFEEIHNYFIDVV